MHTAAEDILKLFSFYNSLITLKSLTLSVPMNYNQQKMQNVLDQCCLFNQIR